MVPADVIDSDAELATLMAAHELLQGSPDKAERYRAHVSCGMHDAICRLYDHLWDQAPPEDNPAERARGCCRPAAMGKVVSCPEMPRVHAEPEAARGPAE